MLRDKERSTERNMGEEPIWHARHRKVTPLGRTVITIILCAVPLGVSFRTDQDKKKKWLLLSTRL